MWDLIVSVLDHCLSFYFNQNFNGFYLQIRNNYLANVILKDLFIKCT